MATIRHLFSTPFLAETITNERLLADLRKAILAEQERDGEGVEISNLGGWHSNNAMLEWGGGAAKALAQHVAGLADKNTVDAKSVDASRFAWHVEMWANVSGKGHANQYHFHPGAYWSAVVYIDDGYEGSDDSTLGGELQMMDPRMPMVRMTAPDLRMLDPGGKVQDNEVGLRPKTGMIVMFPSWLQHAVRPFQGEGTRISVAINLVPVLKPKKA